MSRENLLRTSAGTGVTAAAYALLLRPRQLHWGATRREVRESMPGDDLVPHPLMRTTRAITIRAPAEDVWPWLVQLGYDRAGFYSYAWLENLIGLNIKNADRIEPELRTIEMGSLVPFGPEGAVLRVVDLEPQKVLVYYRVQHPITGREIDPMAPRPSTYFAWSWAFRLDPRDGGTRLVVRARGDYRPRWLAPAIHLLLEPIDFLMERKMLLGIRERAEGVERRTPVVGVSG